jgi:hypothetical protein
VEHAKQLPHIQAVRDDVLAVHSQVLQDVLRRIEKTFQAVSATEVPKIGLSLQPLTAVQ